MQILDRIDRQLDILERRAAAGMLDRRVPSVSSWSVAQQLDHTLKAATALCERLTEDQPQESKTPFHWTGRVVLALGWIPRGVGKAPEATIGTEASPQELDAALARCRAATAKLRSMPERLADPRRLARHPRFGGITPAQALRFAEVHTNHHLKILREIDRAG